LEGSAVARRYARALYEAAEAAGATDKVGEDLAAVTGAVWGDDRLREFFLSDRVPAQAKKELIARLAGEDVHRLARNLLLLAVDKRREDQLPGMARAYAGIRDRARGIADAEIRTAVEVGPDERRRIEQAVAARLGREVRVSFVVQPSLVGGLQVRVDDRLIDASLRSRLERLRDHLAQAKVGV